MRISQNFSPPSRLPRKPFQPELLFNYPRTRITRRNWNSNAPIVSSFLFVIKITRTPPSNSISEILSNSVQTVLKQIARFFLPVGRRSPRKLKIETGRNNTSSRVDVFFRIFQRTRLSLCPSVKGRKKAWTHDGKNRRGGNEESVKWRREEKQTAFQFHKFMTHTRGNWSGGVSSPD